MKEAFNQLDDNKKTDFEIGEKECWTGEYYVSLECARGAVRAAVSEELEWILASERPPDKGQRVIGEFSFLGCSELYIGTVQGDELEISNPYTEGYVLIGFKQLKRWGPFQS